MGGGDRERERRDVGITQGESVTPFSRLISTYTLRAMVALNELSLMEIMLQ